jgi:hypothetical protein
MDMNMNGKNRNESPRGEEKAVWFPERTPGSHDRQQAVKRKKRRRPSLIPYLIPVVTLLLVIPLHGQNPFLPPTAFIPDGEPHVFEYKGEKRVYVYGSRDERVTAYCGYGHDVWSAPADDLTQWTNHGEIFNVKQVLDIGYGIVDEQHFGAPDCVYNPVTGKYYLYTFLGALYRLDGKEGPLPDAPSTVPGFGPYGPKCVMAQSDSPTGPFLNPVMCDWPPANDRGAFDPAVLVDRQDDGSVRVYAYWGMVRGDRCAELDPHDMHTIINPETRKPDRNAFTKTLPDESSLNGSSLFEASSIRKVADGKYVFIYSPNEAISTLTYCYGNSPLGPWTYGGKIINNQNGWRGGNDHGGIFEVNGQWYVVYHRPGGNNFNRQAMIEPIRLTIEAGRVAIPEVEMTSQGVLTNGLDPFRRYYAGIVCYRDNHAYIDGAQRNTDGMNPLVNILPPVTTLGYKYFNFGPKPITDRRAPLLRLHLALLRKAKLTILISPQHPSQTPAPPIPITSVELNKLIPEDGQYHQVEIPLTDLNKNPALQKAGGLQGKQALYLKFEGEGGELCRLKEIEFAQKGAPTPNPLRKITTHSGSEENGTVTVIPDRARGGESIKATITTKEGYRLARLTITDDRHKEIKATENARTPFGQQNYHFVMPNRDVKVVADFEPTK